MKKLLLVVVLLMVVAVASYAQVSASASVSANVNATLTIAAQQNLSFPGFISQGAAVTVLSNAATAARFYINGAASAATTVTVTSPANLISGSNTLPFTAVFPRSNTTNAQGTSTQMPGTADGVAVNVGTATTGTTGDLFVWVGGKVTADPAQPTGAYSGVIGVVVTQP